MTALTWQKNYIWREAIPWVDFDQTWIVTGKTF